MSKSILVINGHPDPRPERFCAALAQAYADGARAAGHQVRALTVGDLDFPLIRSREAFEAEPPAAVREAQALFLWARHVVLVHPLWLGAAPAHLCAFFEQAFRQGFALPAAGEAVGPGKLAGRSARLIVTMNMPGALYASLFGEFGVRAMKRGVLGMAGMKPIEHTYVGKVDGPPAVRHDWLAKVGRLGAAAV
jgi:putative NADPH-quinone reductase